MKWRNRVKEGREVRADQILNAPWNTRTHEDLQKETLEASVSTIGFFDPLDVFEPEPGVYMLIDGEARKELINAKVGPDTLIPVNVTDLTEEEAKLALLVKDPIAAMAGQDDAAFEALRAEIETDSDALNSLIDGMAPEGSDEDLEEGEVELKQLSTKNPPAMSWVIVGIPTVRFGEISADIERMALIDGITLETTVKNG